MNSSLQSNDWKKTLQTFLKGQGKTLMNDFSNKAIMVSLVGGSAFVVDSKEIDKVMAQKGLNPVLQQHLEFRKTENNTQKAYYKEAPSKEKVNLVVYKPHDDIQQRKNLFAINEIQDYFDKNPEKTQRGLQEFYQYTNVAGSLADRVSAKIGKILADSGFPHAFIVLFKDNEEMLQNIQKYCQSQEYGQNQSNFQNTDIPDLLEELNMSRTTDYCNIFRDYNFDHCKLNNLYHIILGAQALDPSPHQKKQVCDFVMACLKLDVNCPTPYLSQSCGVHCAKQCKTIKEFLENYFN